MCLKVLFLTDNFPPEVNAPASRTYEHCREWVKKGIEVTVLTCFPNYPQGKIYHGYKNKLYQVEYIDGIKVIRLWSYVTANEGFVKRILDYISFAFMAFWAGLFKKTDIIVATSPQFFTAIAGGALGFFKRTPWVFEVRDLWPESIRAVNALEQSKLLDALELLELFLYRRATRIVVVTEAFKENIVRRGIDPSKIDIVKNGVILNAFLPRLKDAELIAKLGLKEKFVVAYMGTHGMAHKLDFLIKSAKKITDSSIQFIFIGDGAEKAHLLKLIEAEKPQNVLMLPSVSKSEIANYISITDVALVNLKKSDTFKTVIPSKIFENAAMQKPILLGVEGESQEIIEKYQAGICFEPENESDFVTKLLRLKNDRAFYEQSQKGCEVLANDFDRIKLAHRLLKILQDLIKT